MTKAISHAIFRREPLATIGLRSPLNPSITHMPQPRQIEWIVDRKQCDRARLARDPRFDGAFFTCVKTTKIYCRPICPSTHAASMNPARHPGSRSEA